MEFKPFRKLRLAGNAAVGNYVTSVAIHGNRIVSTHSHSYLKVWDIKTMELERSLRAKRELATVVGNRIIAADTQNNRVEVWNADEGVVERTIENRDDEGLIYDDDSLKSIAFGGSLIILGIGRDMIFYNADERADPEKTVYVHEFDSRMVSVAIDEANMTCVGVSKNKLTVLKWNKKYNFTTLFEEDVTGITCVAIYGNIVVFGNETRKLNIWNTSTKNMISVPNGGKVNSLAIYADRIVSGMENYIKIWDAKTGELVQTLDNNSIVRCIDINEGRIVAGENNDIKIWINEQAAESAM